jgi:hypothetical protein
MESLEESLALLKLREPDADRRSKLREQIHEKITQREQELEGLAQQELTPFEDVLTTTEVSMVREFLGNLKSKWAEVPVNLRNNFLRVILDQILVTDFDNYLHLKIMWRSGKVQSLISFRPAAATKKRRWNRSEDDILRSHFAQTPLEEILQLLPNREWSEITHRTHLLGLKRKRAETNGKPNPHWTVAEDEVLRSFDRQELSYWEMLKKLENRTYAGIRRRCDILGIRLAGRRIVWRFVESVNDNELSRGEGCGRWQSAPLHPWSTSAGSAGGRG